MLAYWIKKWALLGSIGLLSGVLFTVSFGSLSVNAQGNPLTGEVYDIDILNDLVLSSGNCTMDISLNWSEYFNYENYTTSSSTDILEDVRNRFWNKVSTGSGWAVTKNINNKQFTIWVFDNNPVIENTLFGSAWRTRIKFSGSTDYATFEIEESSCNNNSLKLISSSPGNYGGPLNDTSGKNNLYLTTYLSAGIDYHESIYLVANEIDYPANYNGPLIPDTAGHLPEDYSDIINFTYEVTDKDITLIDITNTWKYPDTDLLSMCYFQIQEYEVAEPQIWLYEFECDNPLPVKHKFAEYDTYDIRLFHIYDGDYFNKNAIIEIDGSTFNGSTEDEEDERGGYNFAFNTGGLQALITAPLNSIQAMGSGTCQPIQTELFGKNISLKCIGSDIKNGLGSAAVTLIQTILIGVITYYAGLNMLGKITNIMRPNSDDRIEVMRL